MAQGERDTALVESQLKQLREEIARLSTSNGDAARVEAVIKDLRVRICAWAAANAIW
jgi:hypothetical protein